jgi:hypothetical protein
MAPTLLGIPLLVHGDEVHFVCKWCGTDVVGPAPPGTPPIPLRQRFGLVFALAFAFAVYGVWFVGNRAMTFVDSRRNRVAAAPASTAPDPGARLGAARTRAQAALHGAETTQKDCESRVLAKDPSHVADIPFWARKKFATTPSPSLAATPYFGFASLSFERDNAAAVGGFACAVPDAAELSTALSAATPSVGDLDTLAKRVETAVAAWHDPQTVVVSKGGCKTDEKWCRVGFYWVDLESKTVRAAATEDAPWVGEDKNEPNTKAASVRLRATVAGWKHPGG